MSAHPAHPSSPVSLQQPLRRVGQALLSLLVLNALLSMTNWWPTPFVKFDARLAPEFVVFWVLLNRSGTTFRKLADADKTDLNQDKAIALMLDQPSMIKRPVLDVGGELLVGFKPDAYAAKFS